MKLQISTSHAPTWALVRAHFVAAAGFAALGGGLLAFGFANPRVPLHTHTLALVHLWLVGWLSLTALGVLVQFVPVTFQTTLLSTRLVWVHLALYVAGVTGLVASFVLDVSSWLALVAGASLWSGFVLAAINLLGALWRTGRRDVWTCGVALALLHATLTPTAGWLILRFLGSGFVVQHQVAIVVAHAHLGLCGWMFGLVVAIGGRMLPMFLITPEPRALHVWLTIVLIQLGLAALAGGVIAPVLAEGGTWLLAAAVILWVVVMGRLFRRRVRRQVDVPLSFAWSGLGLLAAAVVAGIVAHFRSGFDGWGEYGLVAIGGGGGLMVNGLLYKIVPFLMRLERWRRTGGKGGLPRMADVLASVPYRAQLAVFSAGLLCLLVGIAGDIVLVERTGRIVVGVGVILFFLNILALCAGWELRKPKPTSFVVRPPEPRVS